MPPAQPPSSPIRRPAGRSPVAPPDLLGTLVDHMSDLVVVLDAAATVQYVSASVTRLLGWHPVDVIGRPATDLLSAERHADFPEAFAAAAALTGSHGPYQLDLRSADGAMVGFEALVTNRLLDPLVEGLVVVARDDTARRAAEDARNLAEALLAEQALLLEQVALGQPLEATMARLVEMVERHVPDAVASIATMGTDGTIRHPMAPSMRPGLAAALDASPTDCDVGQAIRRSEPALFTDISTDPRWAHLRDEVTAAGMRSCWCFPMFVADSPVQLGMLAVFHPQPREPRECEREVLERARTLGAIAVERRRFATELEHQAVHDVLTGLPNRTLLLDRVEHALARSVRQGDDVAVLFVDLDHFKLINDSLGHSAGDRLLEQVAERFRDAVRTDDTVGRFGGDEFVVVCEDIGGEVGAIAVADRLAHSLLVPMEVDGAEVVVTASVGIAVAGPDTADAQALIRDADAAMYRAKDQGRARHAVFEDHLHERVVQRLELERALRGALVDTQLTVHYQPVVRLSDGALVGAEALVRWQRPGHGLVLPDSFIAVAEETGLVVPLDRWVMAEACEQAVAWRRTFAPDFRIRVNLSARQLSAPDLTGVVAATLATTGLPAAALGLEITESALAADTDMAAEALAGLDALGVEISIDDFGTGYASLDYVRRFDMADELKIDRSFVADLGRGTSRDHAIVSASLVLARDLGLTSVAEGVETEVQRAVLLALGCDLAQGYLFCPPVAADEFEAWARTR